MQQYTFDNSQVQKPSWNGVRGADHGYIQTTVGGVPGGVQTPAIVAWLRYWIYNDAGGRRYFEGNACVMCAAPWTNPPAQELARDVAAESRIHAWRAAGSRAGFDGRAPVRRERHRCSRSTTGEWRACLSD